MAIVINLIPSSIAYYNSKKNESLFRSNMHQLLLKSQLSFHVFFTKACTAIFLEYGSYGNEDCLEAIDLLQNHLLATLPQSIFQHLSEDRNSTNKNSFQLLIWSKDPRIKLGVFLHPSLTKFRFAKYYYYHVLHYQLLWGFLIHVRLNFQDEI